MERKLSDFVEEKGSPVRQFKFTDLPTLGSPGKGAPYIAEKLALDEIFRKIRAVNRNERSACPVALVVYRLGKKLLTHTAFPDDQKTVRVCSILLCLFYRSLQGRALADNRIKGVFRRKPHEFFRRCEADLLGR